MTSRVRNAIITTGVILVAAYLAATFLMPKADGRVVVGDATHHFIQLRSMVYDRDLDFHNDYVRIYGLTGYVPGTEWIYWDRTPTGRVRNYMPVGPALLWAPLYLVMSWLQLVASWFGLAPRPDGFGRALQMVPGVMGVASATMAAFVSWRCARRFTTDVAAAAGVFAVWLGSHAVYYSLVSPSYSHAASMLTASLFFSTWLIRRDTPSPRVFALWGGLAGLSALMRWQDAIFVFVPLIEVWRWHVSPARRFMAGVSVCLGFAVVFAPQMFVWNALYGQPFAMPQGPSFMQWTSPHLWDVLFSDNHGLFSWAPMLVPATIGLVVLTISKPALRLPIAVTVLVSWYVNAAVADWWAGEAFGARRFLSLFPLFAIGLARWLDPARVSSVQWRIRAAVVVALGALNWLLLLQYQLFMKGLTDIAPYPHGAALWLDRFAVPFRLLASWLR